MAMIYITRRETFNAAHKVFNPEWSAEKNLEVFGKCSNPNWHGHNYVLYVTVKGEPNPETGYVMDLKVLSNIIKDHVIELADHKNFNLDVSFTKGMLATTENIIIAMWKQLEPQVSKHGCRLHSLKLYETENNFVEYFGE
jgi:6-pyruvoyltetrahydropterin/6-carboxytetrahydropterin synthase